jgi:hypothetical protein
LHEGQEELPLAVSLAGRTPQVGSAALALARRAPHRACLGFLPAIGTGRQWAADRHRLSAGDALGLVFGCLASACRPYQGAVLVLPPYLTADQVDEVALAARQAGVALLGSLPTPLAAALFAVADGAGGRPVAVVDVDDHALTLALVAGVEGRSHLLDVYTLPHLGLRAWKERLLADVADRCIRQSRRDPRDSADAEQSLYEDLEHLLDAWARGEPVHLAVRTARWYQDLVVQPEETVQFCAGLVHAAVGALHGVLAGFGPADMPHAVLVTAAAGRLPGLADAIRCCLGELIPAEDPGPTDEFSIVLSDEEDGGPAQVWVLAPDAPARAAHALADLFLRGELPAGHASSARPPTRPAW